MRSKQLIHISAVIAAVVAAANFLGLMASSDSPTRSFNGQLSPVDRVKMAEVNRFIPPANRPEKTKNKFVPDELLVRFKSSSSAYERSKVLKKHGLKKRKVLPVPGLVLTALPTGSDERSVASELDKESAVSYAQTNNIYSVAATPNDPGYSQLWGLNNTGQTINSVTGNADADSDVAEAWDRYTGAAANRVAVIDTGVDYNHEDLASNIWTNAGESGGGKETNNIDDDGNGYADDVRGWDFVGATLSAPAPDNDPMDVNGHGTHVAGTIGAAGNNGVGVAGINWAASIVPVRAFDNEGSGTDASIVPALVYAGRNAGVVNGSFGGYGYSQAERDAISSNPQTLYVFAAGNDTNDNEVNPAYPCSFDEPNVVCVAATTSKDQLSSFSNIGATRVDLGAPGSNVYSTTPDNSYAYYSGTSMATPHVAGAAGLLRGFEPTASVARIKDALLSTTDPLAALSGKTVSGGRLNVANAVEGLRPADGTAKVQIGAGRLTFTAGNAAANNVTISLSSGTYTVSDSVATLTAGAGCTIVSSQQATCSSSGVTSISASTGDLNDTISSSAATPMTVFAGSGNDTITGGAGNDAFDGGPGADAFNGSGGVDSVDYSARSSAVTATINGTANDGEAAENDNVKTDIENVIGGSGNDSLTGSTAANVLTGNSGNDTLVSGDGNDTILPGLGTDTLDGGNGVDAASYSDRSSSVSISIDGVANDGGAGENDSIGSSIENLVGGSDNDTLTGTSGANVLSGGAGNDSLRPGTGVDTLNGDSGIDTADYSERTATVTVTLNNTADDGVSGEADNVKTDVESIRSGSGNDALTGSSADNTFDGGTGNDVFNGLGGTDTASYSTRTVAVTATIDGTANDGIGGETDNVKTDIENLTGGSGADTLTGGAAANRIEGGAGNDMLNGGDANDTLVGNLGNDVFNGGNGTDTVDYWKHYSWEDAANGLVSDGVNVSIDGVANDGLRYPQESDNVKTDVENINGTWGSDTLTGSAGDNRLDGSYWTDQINGLDGNDTVIAGPTDEGDTGLDDETITGGNGDDVLQASNQIMQLDAEPGADTYIGGAKGNTTLSYSARSTDTNVTIDSNADDGATGEGDKVTGTYYVIQGGSGNDTLTAGPGVVSLLGAAGNDTLTGRNNGWTILHGDDGDDTLKAGIWAPSPTAWPSGYYGDNGNDTVSFQARTGGVNISLDYSQNDGQAGENSYVAATTENVIGSDFNDVLAGSTSDNKLEGKEGADQLSGLDGNDTLIGGATDEDIAGNGSNSYDGGNGNDTITAVSSETMFAEPGADKYQGATTTVDYSARTSGVSVSLNSTADDGSPGEGDNVTNQVQSVIGSQGDDTLSGNGGINYFWGRAGNDTLDGEPGGDYLNGEDGDDIVDDGGSTGQWSDSMYGGSGTDTVTYANRATGVRIDLNPGSANGVPGEGDYISSGFERAIGGGGSDTMIGNDSDNYLDGGESADSLTGNDGNDTLVGGAIDEDTMSNGLNSYDGGNGDDTIRSAGSNEVLYAEPGADTYFASTSTTLDYSARSASVSVTLDALANDGAPGENDKVSSGIQTVTGTNQADSLTGNNSLNVFNGLAGGDTINGGLGGDLINAGDGDDTVNPGLKGGSWSDAIYGGAGTDTVTYSDRTNPVSINLNAGSGNGESGESTFVSGDFENAIGGDGADTITGNALANVLTGGAGADTVSGLAGNDSLMMRVGDNDPSLTCGDGTDSVTADALPFDPVNADCETVSRP